MATQLLVRPSPCVVVAGRGFGERERLPRRASSCKLRCSLDECNASAVKLAPPTINLEILGPEVGGEATITSAGSGEKVLRNIIPENKLELYGLYV